MAAESAPREDTLTVAGGYTCVVGEHAGVDRDDARTTADVLCHALASHGARPGVYDIRIGKLGGKQLLVLVERGTNDERRLFIQGVDEVPVASERLVTALVEHKSLEQTESVDNVVSSESRTPKQKTVQPGVILGLTGQSAVGGPTTASAGVELDMQFRLKNLALLGQGRAGGIGSADNKLGYASLGVGVRYFLSDADVAPFIGGGLMFAYFQANEGNAPAYDGSGFGAYGELGLAFMRSSHVGGVVNLRADVPMFSLTQSTGGGYDYETNTESSVTAASMYLVPLSFNVGLSFQ
ncbi:MAG TPA: hypothetical protein VGL81_34085 [Polyangiaceae bacterium]|jgi:hypothetical protein